MSGNNQISLDYESSHKLQCYTPRFLQLKKKTAFGLKSFDKHDIAFGLKSFDKHDIAFGLKSFDKHDAGTISRSAIWNCISLKA